MFFLIQIFSIAKKISMRLKLSEYDDSLISSTSNFTQSWFNLIDWWIQALFMTTMKWDSESFEVHWKRTLIFMKFKKIVLIMKSWCISHVIYFSIVYVDSMLHLFDRLSIWLMCRETLIEDQSYFQSSSQWISIKASNVDLNFYLFACMQHFHSETSADLLFNQSDKAFISFLRFHFAELSCVWWVSCFIFMWLTVWIQCFDRWLCWTRQTEIRLSRLDRQWVVDADIQWAALHDSRSAWKIFRLWKQWLCRWRCMLFLFFWSESCWLRWL